MIYMIRAIGTGYVKVGKNEGKDISLRLAQLQVGCPFELRVLALADWPAYMEGVIHRHLYQQAVRGEWFTLGDRTRQVLKIMQDGRLDVWHSYLDGMRETGQRGRIRIALSYVHELAK